MEFCAAHAITIRGLREPIHGHNWRVRAVVAGPELDADGLLCDFHAVEAALSVVLGPWRNRNLNEVEPFTRVNPSAENVAREIREALSRALAPSLGVRARVARVSVTEAPGCEAVSEVPVGGEDR